MRAPVSSTRNATRSISQHPAARRRGAAIRLGVGARRATGVRRRCSPSSGSVRPPAVRSRRSAGGGPTRCRWPAPATARIDARAATGSAGRRRTARSCHRAAAGGRGIGAAPARATCAIRGVGGWSPGPAPRRPCAAAGPWRRRARQGGARPPTAGRRRVTGRRGRSDAGHAGAAARRARHRPVRRRARRRTAGTGLAVGGGEAGTHGRRRRPRRRGARPVARPSAAGGRRGARPRRRWPLRCAVGGGECRGRPAAVAGPASSSPRPVRRAGRSAAPAHGRRPDLEGRAATRRGRVDRGRRSPRAGQQLGRALPHHGQPVRPAARRRAAGGGRAAGSTTASAGRRPAQSAPASRRGSAASRCRSRAAAPSVVPLDALVGECRASRWRARCSTPASGAPSHSLGQALRQVPAHDLGGAAAGRAWRWRPRCAGRRPSTRLHEPAPTGPSTR